jgi:hypothetical protein
MSALIDARIDKRIVVDMGVHSRQSDQDEATGGLSNRFCAEIAIYPGDGSGDAEQPAILP